jgi:hypothetical protein
MTQDVYLGRKAVDPAATALDTLCSGPDGDLQPGLVTVS